MRLKTLLLAIGIVLAAAVGLQAGKGGCPGQGHYEDFMSGLTPEQTKQVKELTDTHHEALFALQKELGAKHEEMETLFNATPPDKAAIDAAVTKVNELQAKKATVNANYRLALTEITGKPIPTDTGGCAPKARCAGAGCPQSACDQAKLCGDANCTGGSNCSAAPGCGAKGPKCPAAQGS